MEIQDKTKEELIIELQELKQQNSDLKALIEKGSAKLITSNKEFILQNEDLADPSSLRQKAEELLKKKSSETASPLSEAESIRPFYELQVHHIELELQNEELRRSQHEAAAANDKYFRLYDLAPSGYFTLSRKGEIIELNLAGALMLGKDRSRLINNHFHSFVSKDTREVFKLFLEKTFKNNTRESCEVTLTTSGKQPEVVHLTGIATGSMGQCFVTAVIITERRKTETLLKASEEKYHSDLIFLQSILESPISIVIFSLDKNYCYTKFSLSHQETMKKIWGIDIRIGMNMVDLIPNMEDREKAKHNFDRALKGDSFVVEEEYGDKELARIFYDNYYSPVKDTEGNIAGISVFILDVSQRKQAEQKISELNTNLEKTVNDRTEQYQEALSRLGKIADRVPGVVYQYRLNPDGSSCFPYASEGIRDIYRVSPDEVVHDASAVFARIHPDDLEGVVASIKDSARTLSLWQHDYRVKFSDGTIRWLAGNAMPQQLADGSVLSHGFITDITEREEAENSLRKSEAEKAAIIRAVPDLMFRIRRDGTYLDYMSSDQNMLFVPGNQFIGKTISQVLPPDLATQSMAAIEKAFHQQEVEAYEYSLTANGKLKYFENRIIVTAADEVLSIVRDITHRKESEVALSMQNAAFESFALAIIITDIKGIIQWANSAFTGLTGYTASETIGKTPGVLVKSGKQDKDFYKRFWDTLLNKEVWTGELINRRKDGSLYYEEQTSTPVLDSNGNISSFISIKIDITERKKLFMQLADQKRRLEDILKGTKAGTWEWNVQTGETVFNEQWAEMLGYTLEEISPVSIETWMKFAHPDDLPASDELLNKHFKGELDYYTFESRMKHKSGEWIWVLDRGRVHEWDNDGKPVLMSGTHQDITEQKRIEKALVNAKIEAEKSNQAKSEFLSRMSHELRTPMNSILGFAQLIDMGELNPKQKKSVSHILNSGKHLLNLINEVLDISGIEAGRVSLTFVPVNLSRIIRETVDTLHPAARAKQVKFELDNADNDPLFVNADPHRLRQVLLNLISNAIKYNREDGSVTIKTELQKAMAPEMPIVRISVSDKGPGIQAELIEKLFMPFERIGAEKTGIEGTGLGLMVVKKLMETMGGSVGVESVPGEGSTFWIELPHIANQETEAWATESRSLIHAITSEKTGTILYIEDNASNTELVEQILLDHRKSIHFVSSTKGKEAVPMAIEYAPDLILLDLDLPDMQGIEVIRLLQTEEKTLTIPVVIVSADAMTHQVEKLINAGAKDYLTKPLDIRAFLQVVDEYLGSA